MALQDLTPQLRTRLSRMERAVGWFVMLSLVLLVFGFAYYVYNTAERPEASFGESYFGGTKEDYDVIKVDTGAGYTIFATDGDMGAWTHLWQAATNGFTNDADYFKVQGLNVDGTPNPAYENLLDVDDDRCRIDAE